MARLASRAKAGYYPTPPGQVEHMEMTLRVKGGSRIRILDPCVGCGTAVALLASLLERHGAVAETWGVELSPNRAEEARERVNNVLATDFESAHVRDRSCSLLFLNPPYDTQGFDRKGREEEQFLKRATPALMPGGVLLYIITEDVFRYSGVAHYIAASYEDVRVMRFTPDAYAAFKQVVIVGRKRAQYRNPASTEVELLTAQELRDLDTAASYDYDVPAAPAAADARAFFYRPRLLSDYVREVQAGGIDVAGLTRQEGREDAYQPAMPMKKGHLAMMLSAGLSGQLWLEEDGQPILVVGSVLKHVEYQYDKKRLDGKGGEIGVTEEVTPFPIVTVARRSGLASIRKRDELATFVSRHADQMTELILEQYRQQYDFDPAREEWRTMDHLSRDRHLPGREETGLLVAQKHVACALRRLYGRGHASAIVNGEMGVGKTTIAAAVAEMLHLLDGEGFPLLIACPSHLVENWVRELRDIIPGVVPRIIVKGAWRTPEEAAKARRKLRTGGTDCSLIQFMQDWEAGTLGPRAAAIISYSMLKLGSGWIPQFQRDQRGRIRCPTCGQETLIRDGTVEEWDGKKTPRFRPATVEELKRRKLWCAATVGRMRWDPDEEREVWVEEQCNGALFQEGAPNHPPAGGGRWGCHRRVAGCHVLRQYRHVFPLFVADEVHKAKGGGRDIGMAFGNTVRLCLRTLALTGTLFGGKSKSLFYILYRMFGDVRARFGYREEDRWARTYGFTKQRFWMEKRDVEQGRFTGWRRQAGSISERPGVSPAVLRHLLPATVFLTLADLGQGLPPYVEEPATVVMTGEQRKYYHRIDSEGKRLMMQETPRVMGAWLRAMLDLPDAGFMQWEVVARVRSDGRGDGDVDVYHLGTAFPAVNPGLWLVGSGVLQPDPSLDDPKLPGLLPKEAWLVEECRREMEAGRRVIVYVRATGKRDVAGRLVTVLRQADIKAKVLRQSVAPRKRIQWLQRNRPDVLVVNPRLVETGLNLVEFSTVIFYQIVYSLYTVWQACRRVWRLGQESDVRVVFVCYGDAMEATAVRLVGEKMLAAKLLYGEEATGAIIPDQDEAASFMEQLANRIAEERSEITLENVFRASNEATALGGGDGRLRQSAWLEEELAGGRRAPARVLTVNVADLDPAAWDQLELF